MLIVILSVAKMKLENRRVVFTKQAVASCPIRDSKSFKEQIEVYQPQYQFDKRLFLEKLSNRLYMNLNKSSE